MRSRTSRRENAERLIGAEVLAHIRSGTVAPLGCRRRVPVFRSALDHWRASVASRAIVPSWSVAPLAQIASPGFPSHIYWTGRLMVRTSSTCPLASRPLKIRCADAVSNAHAPSPTSRGSSPRRRRRISGALIDTGLWYAWCWATSGCVCPLRSVTTIWRWRGSRFHQLVNRLRVSVEGPWSG